MEEITMFGHLNFRPAKLQAKKGFATAMHQINILILGVNYISTCCPKPVMLLQNSKEKNFTLWVSRNLLISLEIRSLLSSSISIVLISSFKKIAKKEQLKQTKNKIKERFSIKKCKYTSSFFSFFLFLRWESSSCEGAFSSAAYSRVNPSIAPLTIRSFFFVSSSRTSSSSSPPPPAFCWHKKY